MNCSITAQECKDAALDPNAEGQSLRWPASLVEKCRPNRTGIGMITENHQGKKDCKEAQDVKDQYCAFESRQQRAPNSVNSDTQQNHCPQKERSMPGLPVVQVVRMGQYDGTLYHGSTQIGC